ncbi:MAG: ABC transporter substrate-binding protein [Bacteroidales bacterium]
MKLKNNIYLCLAACIAICSCNGKTSGRQTHVAGNEGLPGRNHYATHFKLTDSADYTILEIIEPWQGASGVIQKWYLIEEDISGFTAPKDDGAILQIPVRSIVCMSATHVAMVSALGMEDALCGVSGTGLIFDQSVRNSIASGHIREVGYDENMNRELLVEMAPDLIIAYGIGSGSVSHHVKLAELGLKVMYNADYLENDPLGKAEWIRVFGVLLGKRALADSIFVSSEEEYISIKETVLGKNAGKPHVMMGLPWKESWYISPGNSYISKLIEDAGGSYLWNDLRSDFSMPFNLENVYVRAVNADYWLNPGTATHFSDIISTDHRLSSLKAFSEKRIYNNNLMVNLSGANDYWETGSLRPGLILKDMAMIFNKDLFPGDTLRFFRQLQWK